MVKPSPSARGAAGAGLSHPTILEVHAAALAAGLASSRAALFAGVDPRVVAGLPLAPSPAAQLLSDLTQLDQIGPLADGVVPLRTWLMNALQVAGPRREAAVFRRALIEVALSSDAPPAAMLEAMVMPSVPFEDAAAWRARMAQAERCICRVEIARGAGWAAIGTGFLVGPDVMLTNAHVAETIKKNGSGRAQLDYAFDAAGAELRGPAVAFAASWSLAESPEDALDYALVRLAERAGDSVVSGEKRGWLAPRRHAFVVGEPLFILQHPEAERLKIGVGTVTQVAPSPPRVRYTANTLPGSSGSPCFTMAWDLVAIHHAGESTTNRGIPLSAVIEDLAAKKLSLDGAAL